MNYRPLAKLIDLHDGFRISHRFDQHHILLLQEKGKLFACDAVCPHQETKMQQADVSEGIIICPRHAMQFSLITGACLTGPNADCSLGIYELVYIDNTVGVYL